MLQVNMSIQDAYDNWSVTYDMDENLTRDLDQAVTRKTLMGLRSESAVELGCGTGKNTLLLSQIAKKVYAIDFSAAMIEKAKQKASSANVTFMTADITQAWAFGDESKDLITCNLVLEHIEDLSFIFSEAFRVLTRSGYLFISELHSFRQYQGRKANFQRNQAVIEIPAFIHHISDFFDTGKKQGFQLEQFNEWWHEQDQGNPPRLASFLFKK
jgi:ubiquinone/menaquinone biosynthesis C-methylase UbiE